MIGGCDQIWRRAVMGALLFIKNDKWTLTLDHVFVSSFNQFIAHILVHFLARANNYVLKGILIAITVCAIRLIGVVEVQRICPSIGSYSMSDNENQIRFPVTQCLPFVSIHFCKIRGTLNTFDNSFRLSSMSIRSYWSDKTIYRTCGILWSGRGRRIISFRCKMYYSMACFSIHIRPKQMVLQNSQYF